MTLTPDSFRQAVASIEEERIQPTQLVMHPLDGIRFSVMQEESSYVTVRKPIRERIRSCARWVRHWKRNRKPSTADMWYDDCEPFTLRDMARWWVRELRIKTWQRLTPEAKVEIARREALWKEQYR